MPSSIFWPNGWDDHANGSPRTILRPILLAIRQEVDRRDVKAALSSGVLPIINSPGDKCTNSSLVCLQKSTTSASGGAG
ncbi:MAG: hypothetical protein ACOYKN_12375 [Pirellula sp.]